MLQTPCFVSALRLRVSECMFRKLWSYMLWFLLCCLTAHPVSAERAFSFASPMDGVFYLSVVNNVFSVIGFAGMLHGQKELVTAFFSYNIIQVSPHHANTRGFVFALPLQSFWQLSACSFPDDGHVAGDADGGVFPLLC
jgi:hypothetical protein